ncbi:MAG: GHMP kinase [Phycisphaerae bacterium]|nr:GHMP kinase [Phycisphaerae bacterium]
MKLFVPGRVCLFGEHSDWAGGYRRIDSRIEKGYTLITGTNQGIYANVEPHPDKLILQATTYGGQRVGPYEVPMDLAALRAEAERGEFFSYACGVAYQIATHYHVRGLDIDNYATDLPIKKGLSSSAAICVLVARAFNRIYDLKMTIRGEMEYAYQGEIVTPSRCGRMDQGCAYGDRPIMMTYDGDRLDVEELPLHGELYLVLVDLCAGKDTMEILASLNRCFPSAADATQKNVQEYLGPINKRIVHEAREAVVRNDARRIGELMVEAQKRFDDHLQPACPSQLTAPVLHKLLAFEPIQPHVWGGKGVGSQGDGTAQFVCRSLDDQDRVVEIIEAQLEMPCLKLVLRAAQKVRKAIIPAAGFSTALYPASKATKRELLPVIDRHGVAKPAILTIIEEAVASGIEEIGLIIQPDDEQFFEELLTRPTRIEQLNRLPREKQDYESRLMDLGRRVTLIRQDVQDGFGHAVCCAREFVGNEPFLLMLGDHVYASDIGAPCAQQLLDAYDAHGTSIVSLRRTAEDDLHHYGAVGGSWREEGLLEISEIVEKPEAAYARDHLRIPGIAEQEYLTLFGHYVIKPAVFDILQEQIEHNLRERGEFQLTPALDRLRQTDGFLGWVVQGRRFDIGDPESYLATLNAWRKL